MPFELSSQYQPMGDQAQAIAKLTKERASVEARLADPATWSGPPAVAAELQKDKLRLERELAHAEHEWLTVQEALEAA